GVERVGARPQDLAAARVDRVEVAGIAPDGDQLAVDVLLAHPVAVHDGGIRGQAAARGEQGQRRGHEREEEEERASHGAADATDGSSSGTSSRRSPTRNSAASAPRGRGATNWPW